MLKLHKSTRRAWLAHAAMLLTGFCAAQTAAAAVADPNEYLATVRAELTKSWPANRAINIVCHGHSVPAGYFRTPVVDTFNAYPHLLHHRLKSQVPYAVINVINTAIGGENSESGALRFASEVLVHRPDVLTIDYALNDRAIGLARAEAAWRTMITNATARGIKVILLTPTPDQGANLGDPADPLNQHAAQVRRLAAEYQVGLVDSLAAFQREVDAGTNLSDLMSQGNHPNRAGHDLVTAELLRWFITSQPFNLAPAGTATASSVLGGVALASRAIDGIRDGDYYRGSVWQSDCNDAAWLEVDLGSTYYLDRVQLFSRSDSGVPPQNFKIQVRDASNAVLFQQNCFTNGDQIALGAGWGTDDMRGVRGRYVRVARNVAGCMALAEFEVYGQSAPILTNLALGKPVTASPAGFGTAIANGNDGNLDGYYGNAGNPIYHSASSGVGTFWQVDLQSTTALGYVLIFNRVDWPPYTTNRLSVLDGSQSIVWSTNVNISRDVMVLGAFQYGITVPIPAGVTGRYVRLETTLNEFLAFGELQVFPAAAIVSPVLTSSLSPESGQLALSWPTDYQTWILQMQTSALHQGLVTNWVDLGAVSGAATNLPVSQLASSVFYRLRQP